jgi:hypothetical protein
MILFRFLKLKYPFNKEPDATCSGLQDTNTLKSCSKLEIHFLSFVFCNLNANIFFAEAEYAVRLNKPIIPLLMQNKYSPQGWLGISIGSKIYYNFATYAVEEKYPSLVKEVRSYYTITDDQLISVTHDKPEKSRKLIYDQVNSILTQNFSEFSKTPIRNLELSVFFA